MLRSVRRLPCLVLLTWLGCGEPADPPAREVSVDDTGPAGPAMQNRGMEDGTILTPDQSFALSRSALFVAQ